MGLKNTFFCYFRGFFGVKKLGIYTFSNFFFQGKIKSTQVGFEPETIKLESGGQGNFLKFFQKEFYSKQGGYLREKNIFYTKKKIFGRF